MKDEKRHYEKSKAGTLLTLCSYKKGMGGLRIGSVACRRHCTCFINIDENSRIVSCSYLYHNSPESKIEKIAADCKKSLEDGIIKFEQLEGILKNKPVEKEPEKSIEEQVFELIKDDLKFFVITPDVSFKQFEIMHLISDKVELANRFLFLAIMQGIHKLIEGDKKNDIRWIFRLNERIPNHSFYEITQITYEVKCLPDFFYFSTEKNAEKANRIVSDFFNTDIRPWWF